MNRTSVHAGRILALLAGHGNVETFLFPLHHPNAAAHRVGYTVVFHRTDQLAESASGAFFMINYQYFSGTFHRLSPFNPFS
jgi:hypothetical protein